MGAATYLEGVLDRIEAEFGLSQDQLATTIGTTPRTLERWRLGESFPQRESRQRLDSLVALGARLRETFSSPGAISLWLHTNSTYLGRLRPVDVLRAGRIDRVDAALEALDSGAFV